MADTVDGIGRYGSHDHILEIEKRTGGRILAAPGKKCTLAQMWLYGDRAIKPAYFINCPFPPSILSEVHREKEFSTNPGYRHDLLLDFEKKRLVQGKWKKDEQISLGEKRELLAVLDSFSWVAWAGMTPHGVHAGLYFGGWVPTSWSGQIVKWVGEQIERAGYSGSVAIDWSPSVNCNRPSRFLDEFSFWRSDAKLDAGAAIAESRSLSESRVSVRSSPKILRSGSLEEQSKREDALRARANMQSATATALEVGETVEWVERLWLDEPQEAWNPFNRDLQKLVGPRSSFGYERQQKFTIHHNAAWSWEWCWSQRMDFETAREMVFFDPIFEDILKVLRSAWEESVSLNKGPQKTATWQEWVEADLERCYVKFGSRCVRTRTVDRVKEAAIRTGKDSVTVSEIARKTGLAKSTVSYAFRVLRLECVRKGKKSYFPLPAKWMPTEAGSGEPSLPVPSPSPSLCVERKDPAEGASTPGSKQEEKGRRRKKKLTPFETFWRQLAPPLVGLPCPVGYEQFNFVSEIEEALSRGKVSFPDWQRLLKPLRDQNKNDIHENLSLSLLLQLVRACLCTDGHVLHPESGLMTLLTQLLGEQAQAYMQWLKASGYIVIATGLSGDGQTWIAWRYFLEGEARFAWNIIEHCLKGGTVEIVCGEPGTGKTQYIADKLLAAERAGRKCRAGSAIGNSAQQLRGRLPAGSKLTVETLHKAYDIPVEVQELPPKARSLSGDLLIADEFGQFACDAAGVLALRWRRGAEVVLSVGLGQHLPVGPGCVGEDLVVWLANHNLPGCKVTQLVENHRINIDNASGIIHFFRAVIRGELPQQVGKGMEIVWCNNSGAVLDTSALQVRKNNAICFAPTTGIEKAVIDRVLAMERCTEETDCSNPWEFHRGERLIVKRPGAKARQAGLRKGDRVEVAEAIDNGFNPKSPIRVRFGESEATLLVEELDRAHSQTGYSAQGAETGVGIVSVIKSRATTRSWLYTSVSRCRQKCVLVATEDGLKECLANNPRRRTCLPALLDKAAAALGLPTE